MATVTKARSTTAGATKTPTKPVGTKASTSTTAAKGNPAMKGTPAATTAPRPKMGRFMMGMVAYLIGSYVIQYVIIFLDVKFKWNLEKKTLVTLPILGPINGITLIFLVSLVGLLFALYKFRILPSAASMRQAGATAGANAATRGVAARSGATAPKSSTAAKGTLPKTAASRAKTETKNTTVGKPTGSKTATGKTVTTGRTVAATAGANTKATAKKVAAPVVEDDESGENDDLYQQVRSQIRAQARKRKR